MFLLETHKIRKFRTSSGKSAFKFKFIVIGCMFVFCCALSGFVTPGKVENDRPRGAGRSLLSKGAHANINCTKPAINEFPPDVFTLEQRRHGAAILHFFITCYLFVLLAIVCDDYFVPSIKVICDRLHLSEDVAGATFMAAATSSPELFINIVGTFITEGDIGVGTIVGSAVFNILAVPACCGLFSRNTVKLDWWPLTRDCFVYTTTVILLIVALHDGLIQWYEALILVVLYAFYITAMYYNDMMSHFVKNLVKRKKRYKEVNLQHEVTPLLKDNSTLKADLQREVTPLLKDNSTLKVDHRVQVNDGAQSSTTEPTPEVVGGQALYSIPKGFRAKMAFFLAWPITFALNYTIPDCRLEKRKKLWPLTFAMCIVWIGTTSYLLSWMITVVGDTLTIPDSVMGLTFLAAGMSVPEAVSGIIVTNQGHGAMGISSSIGSNTFDILLCLGLPWLIKSAFLPINSSSHIVKINSHGLGYCALSLLTTVSFLYIAFAANKFTLNRKVGVLCLLMYISFLVLASLIELNVFFPVNLPLCER